MVVTEWRLLRLPLVDPVSVTTDLMLTLAGRGSMNGGGAGAGGDATATTGESEEQAGVSSVSTSAAAAAAAAAPGRRGEGGGGEGGGLEGGGLSSFQGLASKTGGGGDEEGGSGVWTSVEGFFSGIVVRMGSKGLAGWGWRGAEFHEAEAAKKQRLGKEENEASKGESKTDNGGDGGDDRGDNERKDDVIEEDYASIGQYPGVSESIGQYPGTSGSSKYPPGFSAATIPDALRTELQAFYTPHVKELNALIGNGRIRWWKRDGSPVVALQRKSLNMAPPPPPAKEGAGDDFVMGSVDAGNFGPAAG
jgi:hypothetical protein